eukprot:284815988_4
MPCEIATAPNSARTCCPKGKIFCREEVLQWTERLVYPRVFRTRVRVNKDCTGNIALCLLKKGSILNEIIVCIYTYSVSRSAQRSSYMSAAGRSPLRLLPPRFLCLADVLRRHEMVLFSNYLPECCCQVGSRRPKKSGNRCRTYPICMLTTSPPDSKADIHETTVFEATWYKLNTIGAGECALMNPLIAKNMGQSNTKGYSGCAVHVPLRELVNQRTWFGANEVRHGVCFHFFTRFAGGAHAPASAAAVRGDQHEIPSRRFSGRV